MMKKVLALVLVISIITLTGCDLVNFSSDTFDNENIIAVQGQEGYYIDDKLSFCAEIRGSYKSDRAFTLDQENENLRVWDNFYLYEYDYFQMVASGSSNIYYSVTDKSLEYVDIEDQFAKATVKLGKSGVYKITFDLSTKLFDLEFKSEITTPVYEKMNGCAVYSLKSDFTKMTVNPNNDEELMVKNYSIDAGAITSFYNAESPRLSNYKVILDESVQGKCASALEDGAKHVSFMVGGVYNLYINPTTYALRVELTNPDTATYSLQVYKTAEIIEQIQPTDSNIPYVFTYQLTVSKNAKIPIFCSAEYVMYDLTVNDCEYLDSIERFNTAGTYSLQINLKTFTITVNYIPQ